MNTEMTVCVVIAAMCIRSMAPMTSAGTQKIFKDQGFGRHVNVSLDKKEGINVHLRVRI